MPGARSGQMVVTFPHHDADWNARIPKSDDIVVSRLSPAHDELSKRGGARRCRFALNCRAHAVNRQTSSQRASGQTGKNFLRVELFRWVTHLRA